MSTKTLQIDPANLRWLEAQTGGRRTLSEALNEILASLRKGELAARGRSAMPEELAAAYEALGEDVEACDVEPFWGAQAEAGRGMSDAMPRRGEIWFVDFSPGRGSEQTS